MPTPTGSRETTSSPRVVLDALGRHGVLVFRDLHLEPEAQVEFCKKLGEIDYAAADDPIPGVMRVTLDRSKNASAPYLKGTFFWHIDGCTPAGDECPQMATVLSAKAVAETGGETEFASTYAAYDDLVRRRRRSASPALRVVHSLEASQRLAFPDPNEKLVACVADAQDLRAPAGVDAPRRTPQPGARRLHRPRRRAWTSTRAGTCWPSCSIGRRARTASTATSGRSATP